MLIRRIVEAFTRDSLRERYGIDYSLTSFSPVKGGGDRYEVFIEQKDTIVLNAVEKKVVIADKKARRLLKVDVFGEGKQVDLSGVSHNAIVDLNAEGKRWEGDVLNDEPYGWGVVYDGDGRMVYEGFRIGAMNVCYGRCYYADSGVIEYEGDLCGGKRWGKGTLYNRKGKVVYDGEWWNGDRLKRRVLLSPNNELLHNHIEELIVNGSSCNGEEWSVLDLGWMSSLKSMRTNCCCFMHVKEVKIVGLRELESVQIGANCFTEQPDNYDSTPNGSFIVRDCPQLRRLAIGEYSFSGYCVFEIENLDCLRLLDVGDLHGESWCFFHASLELRGVRIHSE